MDEMTQVIEQTGQLGVFRTVHGNTCLINIGTLFKRTFENLLPTASSNPGLTSSPPRGECAMSASPRTRLTIPEYAMALAHVASLRSEDPYRKVGAVAIDFDNRVIGTAYNGLAPGYDAAQEFWADRDERRKYMLHAEVNLCSLFTRGNVRLVACTTKPCTSCMQMLCAYGVKEVYYRDDYPESEADAIAQATASPW
jgi:dCMP deaminase